MEDILEEVFILRIELPKVSGTQEEPQEMWVIFSWLKSIWGRFVQNNLCRD